ncbi:MULTISPECIES: hypothetical protein [Marinobacter]|uniref:hypothetical protein n=2 Tax=Marinobacter TaxID=2742 RepID=UPI001B126340|nr:hypothetical protein [Marinobacter sp.]MBO6873056.1 hypothetical protein [Marinobacter sp.]
MMVMGYLKDRLEKAAKETGENPPSWVSEKNASGAAWKCVEELRREKELFIRRHRTSTDFSIKKHYQIKGSEVARTLGMNRSALMNTSSFSGDLAQYIEAVNSELEKAKNEKLKRAHSPTPGGMHRSKKEDLIERVRLAEHRYDELKMRLEEPLNEIYDELPLPIKKKLGIA